MNHPVTSALSDFSARYLQAWCDADRGFPVSEHLVGLISPCVVVDDDQNVTWKPIERQPIISLEGVEKGMDLSLYSDINAFYGSQYSGDMSAMFGDLSLDLLQVFNDDDLELLQQNILGHLVTQRRMKLKPTVFIAVVDDESQVISICNMTGQVVLETLGKDIRQVLANDVVTFLQQLQPLVTEE